MKQAELAKYPESAAFLLPGGAPPEPRARITNKNLARTLDGIAVDGWSGFYAGPVAAEMACFAREHGGFFALSDFGKQKATWGEPLIGHYRDVTIYNTPPPTQGCTVIEMLNLVEPHDVRNLEFLGPDHIHLLVQAKQVAYNDRDRCLTDPKSAIPWDKVPSFGSLDGDTIYIAAIDRDGNAASLIQSLYSDFGSCVVAGSTGVMLQNRGAYFSLDPGHPNRLEPGKIPLHTLIASIGKRDDKLWSVFGCMGADGQPQIQLQAYVGMIDFGLDVQQAIEMPRFLSGRFGLGEARDTLHMESRFPPGTIDALAGRGHPVHRWNSWHSQAGHAHGITVDAQSGTLIGGSDPRSDGAAIGY